MLSGGELVDSTSSRERVLSCLTQAPEGLGVADLSRILALHPNTVRFHLGRLLEEGRLVTVADHTAGRGRPRTHYRVNQVRPGDRRYQELATALVSRLAADPRGAIIAEQIGHAWGKELAVPGPARLVATLADTGFAPASDGASLVMRACPFIELAQLYPQIVCRLHLGMVRAWTSRRVHLQPAIDGPACRLDLG